MNFLLQSTEVEGPSGCSALQNLVVKEARAWVGMRFLHQGRAERPDKALAVDCLGLLVGIATRLEIRARNGGFLKDSDVLDYGLKPDPIALRATLAAGLEEVGAAGTSVRPGDILLFRLAGNPQHLGIATRLTDGRPGLLHAYAPVGRVVEHGFDGPWPGRVAAVFRVAEAANTHLIS